MRPTLPNSKNFGIFKKHSYFIRSMLSSVFNYDNHKPSLTYNHHCNMLHLKLSHSLGQRFKNNFQNCLNLLLGCGLDIKSTSHSPFSTIQHSVITGTHP